MSFSENNYQKIADSFGPHSPNTTPSSSIYQSIGKACPPLLTRIAKKQRIKLSFILTQKKSSARNCATNIFFCTVKKTKSSLFLQQGNYSTKKIYGPIKENSLSVPSYWGILSMTLNDKSVSTIKVNEFMRNSPLENEKPRIIKNKCLSKKYISGIWKHLTKLHQIDSKN